MTSMIVLDLSTFDQGKQLGPEPLSIDAASLYRAFEKVKDGRGKKGKRYPLALILTLVMFGKMVGETTIEAIIDWINLRKNNLKKLLCWPKDFPSYRTYERVLSLCDHQEITEAIAGVVTKARAVERCGDEPARLLHNTTEDERTAHTAMDGKTLRGTLHHAQETQPSVHILTLYDCDTGITIGQYVYKNNESEISAADQLLRSNILRNRIVSTDALHTQKRWCVGVQLAGGYYLTTVKENTPLLYENLSIYFGDAALLRQECEYYKKVQKGHGRLEVREIWTSPHMNSYFARDWVGVAQIFMIRKTVIEKGEKYITLRYGITSLPRKKANAQRLLEIKQNHWRIENRSHYRRDVTLGEDGCQVRTNHAPEVLAALNGGVLAFMDFLGVKNLAKQLRYYNANPEDAIQLLFGKLSRQNK